MSTSEAPPPLAEGMKCCAEVLQQSDTSTLHVVFGGSAKVTPRGAACLCELRVLSSWAIMWAFNGSLGAVQEVEDC